MYPVIYDFGIVNIFGFKFKLAIYSFGLMLVIAFYTCYFLLNYDFKRFGYSEKLASDIIFWSAMGGILGAKTYYILENLDDLLSSSAPLGMIFSGSGLVFIGGLIGAVIAVSVVIRTNKLPWLLFADILAPLIILGYAIGRIGCFLVGDDYGIPTNLPWAISFPNGLPPTTYDVFQYRYPWIDLTHVKPGLLSVHPTQIYETLICICIFIFLWQKRTKIKNQGSLFFAYLILAGIERFFIEFLRTNEKYLLDIFSGAQVLSLIMILIGTYFIIQPVKFEEFDKT
jgi:phosphatidylglycerol:prolipoprotein diacylglycerol transferase